MGGVNRIERAGYLSHAGLSLRSVAAEVLLFLPSEFTAAYEDLWLRAHGQEIKEEAERIRVDSKRVEGRTTSSGVDTMAPAKAGKKKGAGRNVPIGDAEALRKKQRVDRQLRKIARALRGEEVTPRRCTKPSCRKWAESDWTFCPWDGAATEQVDR